MVDAQGSGTCGRKAVEVRVFSWAPVCCATEIDELLDQVAVSRLATEF